MTHWFSSQWNKRKWSHASLDAKLVRSVTGFKLPNIKQWKYIPRLLSTTEKRIAIALFVSMAASAGFLGWAFYTVGTSAVARAGGSYTEGLVGYPQYINPLFLQNNDVDRDLSALLYSSLIRYNERREPVVDAAASYEVSADGKTYTFVVRQGMTWHDGETLNADDVVYTFTKIQDAALKSPLYISFKDVKIEKKDDRTVAFILQKPFAPFLDLMTTGILPQHIWKDIPNEQMPLAAYNLKPVGSGPWKFKTLQKEKDGSVVSYTLVRNESYYGSVPFLDKLTFRFYPDTDAAVQGLKNRNVQGISFLPRELRDRLKKDPDLSYYLFHLPQYTALFFNQDKKKELASKRVRKALTLAIDKDRIIAEAFGGEGSVIASPILPGFLGYDASLKPEPFDIARASQLLTDDGWKKNESGAWYQERTVKERKTVTTTNARGRAISKTVVQSLIKASAPLSLTIVTADQADLVKTAHIVEEGWKALGVIVDVQISDPERIKQEVIDPRAYDVFVYGEIIGSDPDLYPFWHSSQARSPGLNLAGYSNASADKLLEDARAESNQQKRTEMYIKFQKILFDEQPAVFLANPTYNYVVERKVKGIGDNKYIVYPSDRFVDASRWHVKIRRTLK